MEQNDAIKPGWGHLPRTLTNPWVCQPCSLLEYFGNVSVSWECFLAAANCLEKETPDRSQVAPVALTEPRTTASRHWDMSRFSWPWRLQAIASISFTGNFPPHTAVLGTWATIKGSALTGCHIFSPELAVSNLSFSTSALGYFHFDFTLVLMPLSLENLKFFATLANVLCDPRVHVASPQPSHRDFWVGGSQVVTWGTGYYRSCLEVELTCKRHMWW